MSENIESTVCPTYQSIRAVDILITAPETVCEARLCLGAAKEGHGRNEGELVARVGHHRETGQLRLCGVQDEVLAEEGKAAETGESEILTIGGIVRGKLSVC